MSIVVAFPRGIEAPYATVYETMSVFAPIAVDNQYYLRVKNPILLNDCMGCALLKLARVPRGLAKFPTLSHPPIAHKNQLRTQEPCCLIVCTIVGSPPHALWQHSAFVGIRSVNHGTSYEKRCSQGLKRQH